jgi:hypothetical protein
MGKGYRGVAAETMQIWRGEHPTFNFQHRTPNQWHPHRKCDVGWRTSTPSPERRIYPAAHAQLHTCRMNPAFHANAPGVGCSTFILLSNL